jgi:hypothetical protein
MSYVRLDDQHHDGALSEFRRRLSAEVRSQTGHEFPIFQDRDDIAWGDNWQARIDLALDAATFLIPVVSPAFFRSRPCRDEFTRFLDRERRLGRDDLILPLYYITARDLDDPTRREADPIARVLASRQLGDWRELRFEPLDAPATRRALARLASRLRDSLGLQAADEHSLPEPPRRAGVGFPGWDGGSMRGPRERPGAPPAQRVTHIAEGGAFHGQVIEQFDGVLVNRYDVPTVDHRKLGTQALAQGRYGDAVVHLTKAIAGGDPDGELRYRRALARLAVRPLGDLDRRGITRLEDDLDAAIRMDPPCHHGRALLAVVKESFYRHYGMLAPPPQPEELRGSVLSVERDRLIEITDLVGDARGETWQALLRRREAR